MSQKVGRRVRKHTTEDNDPDFKPPPSLKTPVAEEPKLIDESAQDSSNGVKVDKVETNGNETAKDEYTERMTRSRSNTPMKKKKNDEEEARHQTVLEQVKEVASDLEQVKEIVPEVVVDEPNGVASTEEHNDVDQSHNEIEKNGSAVIGENAILEPLSLADEPDPELQFDENSDADVECIEKEVTISPAVSRCVTRRSQTRNIPTPKTPKSQNVEIAESPTITEKVELPQIEIDLNNSFSSCSENNASTCAQVGSDNTRQDFAEYEESSFLNQSKNKSLGETLRGLSSRRTIHPVSEDYRKRVLTNNLGKADLNSTYPSRRSVESISMSLKRKSSVESVDGPKRFKPNSTSPGFIEQLKSPLRNIRNKIFTLNPVSASTPTLTSYKDINVENHITENNDTNEKVSNKWCSIM